ncbi:MAG TPA: VWA domain-containing protein [Pyrinomonadaceae bacterium]|nr:VWA domain-containing protein [Pyrinomonadaceae bacterium]
MPRVEFFAARGKLVAGREQTVDVLIRVVPPELEAASQRPRLNLCVVLDRSGSMQGLKMARAREAASYCVDQLLPTDRLSVVIFDDRVDVLIPSRPADDKEGMKRLLSRVGARDSTALHEAWVRGGMQVSEHLDHEAVNRVLLITDGLANVGLTNTDEIVSQAAGLQRRGVSTSTVGIGEDFNEDLLMPMAQGAGGNAWHVSEPGDLRRIFEVELEGLVAQFAHTVSLGLVPADGVRIGDVLNDFELTETGRYKLPNLQSGSPLEVVVSLRVPARGPGTRLRLLDARLGLTPQDGRAREVIRDFFEVEFAPESEVEALREDERVTKAVRLLMNARARREAVSYMDAGDYAAASSSVLVACAASAASPACDDPELARDAEDLEGLSLLLADRGSDKMSRKLLSYGSLLRRTGRKVK